MNYKKIIIDAGNRMLNSGLTVETWGNISVRDSKTGLIYITPSAMNYNDCVEDDVIVYDSKGSIVEGTRKPTIEKDMHLDIYRKRKEVNAVIHTHPIYSLIFACMRKEIPLIIDEAAQSLGDIVKVAHYGLPGSKELSDNCIEALGEKSNACLLQSHGAVCVGKDIEESFKVATVLEMTAQVYYYILNIGKPVEISKENIASMRDFAVNHYGQDK